MSAVVVLVCASAAPQAGDTTVPDGWRIILYRCTVYYEYSALHQVQLPVVVIQVHRNLLWCSPVPRRRYRNPSRCTTARTVFKQHMWSRKYKWTGAAINSVFAPPPPAHNSLACLFVCLLDYGFKPTTTNRTGATCEPIST